LRIVIRPIAVFAGLVSLAGRAGAQGFAFPAAAATDTAALTKAMPVLASQMLAQYRDSNQAAYRNSLFYLYAVAGSHHHQAETSLRALPQPTSDEVRALYTLYVIHAAGIGPRDSSSRTLGRELRATLRRLDDRQAAFLIRALGVNPRIVEGAVDGALRRQQGQSTIAPRDALALIRAYHIRQVIRALKPIAAPIVAEDDRRRYVIEMNVPVRTPDGATICTMIVRPRSGPRLPTMLNFTIYADTVAKLIEARRAAASGYIGVVGFTRGKLCSPDTPVPYVHDGADAAALIDWIARQPWSDGRVGMYGGSYEGFTQWAAAKHLPPALKTIVPLVAVGPGLDVPMEGNVAMNFLYPWPFYTLNTKTLDDATYNDFPRWNRLNREWYVSGRAYRDLDKIDGTPNPVFDEWIAHPTYDAYWQQMIPYGPEFATLKIPVLSTAGYFFGGPGAALYYFTEHYQHDPAAEQYLVIGPYDHVPGQRGVVNALGDTSYRFAGYQLDSVALMDLQPLRFAWFDYVFKHGPKPAILADRINYEVMGANVWKHAPSVAAMTSGRQRLFLKAERGSGAYRFSDTAPPDSTRIDFAIDLAYRADIDRNIPGGGIVADAIDTVDVLHFESEPFTERTEISGLFSGHLDLTTNKRDFDLYVVWYELTTNGEYILLSTCQLRASHANDLVHRTLLTPGARTRLDFSSIRLISRLMEAGSRIVVLLGPIKAPIMQINYGSGKDVNDETVADAGEPLRLQVFGGSFIEIPIAR
jgi:putative CocE/NonD family hydrolase